MGLHVPIIYLLLFELIPCIPVGLNIVLWQVLWEAVFDKELFIFAELCELTLLLHHHCSTTELLSVINSQYKGGNNHFMNVLRESR